MVIEQSQPVSFDGRQLLTILTLVACMCASRPLAAEEKPAAIDAASTPKGLYGGDIVTGIVGELCSVAYDRDGALWVGSRSMGIFAYKDATWTLFNERNAPIPDVGIATIFVDRKNVKWFVSSRGSLYSFDNEKWHVYEIETFNVLNTVNCLCDDPHGNLWFGMQGGWILRFADGKFSVVVQGNRFSDPNPAPGFGNSFEIVRSVACDSKGRLWAHGGSRFAKGAGADRLLMFDGQKWHSPPLDASLFPICGLMPGEKEGEMLIGSRDGLYAVSDNGQHRRLTPWPPITNPVQVWRAPDGRCVLGNREGVTVVDAEKVRSYRGEAVRTGLWVLDVAFDREQRIWIAARWGLSYLSGDKITAVSLPEGKGFANLTARSWRDKTLAELVNEKISDAKILDVLKDPAKYANQKLRIVGNVRSGFEYANFVDKDGNELGIWPAMYQPWWSFLQASGLDEDPDLSTRQAEDEDLSHARRMGANLRNWPPPAKKPTKNVEYLGYLDWGGNFGHMGGWSREFTTVESYPVDLDKTKRETIHKAYLKYISELPTSPLIDPRKALSSPQDREPLQGTWIVKQVDGLGQYADTWIGWKWAIQGDQLAMGRLGGRLRGNIAIDAHAEPARLDWATSNVHFRHHGLGLGIYRLDGKTLTIAWGSLPGAFGTPLGDAMRPTGFVRDKQNTPIVFTLERTADAPPSAPLPDDPAAVAKAGGAAERDGDGNIVSVWYGDKMGKNTTYPDNALEPLAGLAHLESVSCNWNVVFTPKALASLGNCRQLISFSLGTYTRWTDESVSHLANLSHLETLRISGPEVTDVGLDALAGLTALRQLDLDDVSATGAGLRHLAEFPELRNISFSSKQASDAVIPNVVRCAQLSSLSLTGSGITDRGVGLLRGMKQLQHLDLSSTGITDASLASLSELRELRSLMLVNTAVTSAGFVHLKNLPHLEHLYLNDTHVDGNVLKILPEFKSLQSVSLPEGAGSIEEAQPLVDRDLAISIGRTRIEKSSVAARNNLINEAVRKRWDAQRMEEAPKRCEILMALEINEADLAKIFGAKVAQAVWPVYSKPLEKAFSGSIANNPSYKQAKLADTSVWPATSWGTGDHSREIIALLPAGYDYYSADTIYENPPSRRAQSHYGHYLIIDGQAKHLVDPNRLLMAYRRYQLFSSD